MNSLYGRIKKRVVMTVSAFCADCHYSIRYAIYRVCDELGGRLGFDRLSWYCNEKKHQWILNYLEKKLFKLLNTYREKDNLGLKPEKAPIWICWWQGEENAPLLVKQCIKSIRENAGEHPVHFITKDNVQTFVEMPLYMQEKVATQKMGLAHYADYLRVSLLSKYGGLWLDATIFCSDTIPKECFEYPVFSFKNERKKSKYLSQYQWSCFCLGAWQGHPLFNFLKEAMELYWKTEEKAIDYLFFDYLVLLGLTHIPAARCYQEVPINNVHCDDLQAAMNAKMLAEQWKEVLCKNTTFYKLSWREKYAVYTENGEKTVYAKLLET